MGCCGSQHEDELKHYGIHNSLSVSIITWNVNAKQPPESFGKLFDHNNSQIDIYVVALQEIVDLNAKNLIIDNDVNIVWENAIESILNDPPSNSKQRKSISKKLRYKYTKLRSINLVGILLMIYVKDILSSEITEIMSSKCASGLFDIAGNKGGVGIRFNIFDTSLCFVNCHLAAHKNNIKGRNEDYHKIIQKLTFISDLSLQDEKSNEVQSIEPSTSPSLTLKATNSTSKDNINDGLSFKRAKKHKKNSSNIPGLSILQHDIVYFCGDLNYRLEFDDLEEVYNLIKNKDYNQLLDKDQLLQQIENGYAFADFNEHKINFQPTFKFEPGTNEYEQVKKRIPSYCDRILWKIKKSVNEQKNGNNGYNDDEHNDNQRLVNCIKYKSFINEKMSDHKPVIGLFEIQY